MGDTCSINQARTPGGTASCLAYSLACSEFDPLHLHASCSMQEAL